MRNLLSAASQRMMGILETLVTQENWITISELAAHIGASERTVAADLTLIKKQWESQLQIEISTKYGIRMQNQSIAAVGAVFIELFNSSTTLRWLEELLFSPRRGIEYYEERLFVSRSTLLRRLPKINRFLAERKMTVLGKNNTYEIVGEDEQYLRQFYSGFLLELYGLNLQKHHIDLDLMKMTQIIQCILERNVDGNAAANMFHSEIIFVYYMMFYVVSLIREDLGYQIFSTHPVENEIREDSLSYIQNNFANVTKENVRPIHEFIFNQFHGWDSPEEESRVSNEANAFWDRIFNNLNQTVSEQQRNQLQHILKSLYLTAKFRPYATSALFDRIHIFSLSVQEHNEQVYKLIQNHLGIFSRKIHFDMSLQFPDVLYWSSLAYPAFTSYTVPKSALVISDFSTQHASYLAERLSSFSIENNVPVIRTTPVSYPQGLSNVHPEEYDIILTTVPDLPIQHKNILVINDYPSYKTFYEIYQACLPASAKDLKA